MEHFHGAKAVRLQSCHKKYLTAKDDEESVGQNRNGSAPAARWVVELVDNVPNLLRLRSFCGRYLAASNQPLYLGYTGKKVLQTPGRLDLSDAWEPVREGSHVMLKSVDGHYLRANGGLPPWWNTVTHDVPHDTAIEWMLWDVDIVELQPQQMHHMPTPSMATSPAHHQLHDDHHHFKYSFATQASSVFPDHVSTSSSPNLSISELFHPDKPLRLQSHHGKYLTALHDNKSVAQRLDGSSDAARWTVELVKDSPHLFRFRSCHGLYLTASDKLFLLGFTGHKVFQTLPKRLDSTVEWEPVWEGSKVKLKTIHNRLLRANGRMPPWRNSVTHDIPSHTTYPDWFLWRVEHVETQRQQPPKSPAPTTATPRTHHHHHKADSASFDRVSSSSSALSLSASSEWSAPSSAPIRKVEGRIISYTVAGDDGFVEDSVRWGKLTFVGTSLEELTELLEEETGLDEIVLCWRNVLNKDQLIRFTLQLPPNNNDMQLVVVNANSTLGKSLLVDGEESPQHS